MLRPPREAYFVRELADVKDDTVSFVLVKSWMHRGACLGASGLGAKSAVGSTSAMVKFVEVCACCHKRGRLGVLGVVCCEKLWIVLLSRLS